MDLRQQFHEAIERVAKDYGSIVVEHNMKAAIDAFPAFAPVEPKEWPDAEGLWMRDGYTHYARPYGSGISVAILGNSGHWTLDASLACNRGGWLPATLVVPPALPAEKRPEKPPMLCAQIRDEWDWFARCGRSWLRSSNACLYCAFKAVNRDASDPAALALYDADMAKEQR